MQKIPFLWYVPKDGKKPGAPSDRETGSRFLESLVTWPPDRELIRGTDPADIFTVEAPVDIGTTLDFNHDRYTYLWGKTGERVRDDRTLEKGFEYVSDLSRQGAAVPSMRAVLLEHLERISRLRRVALFVGKGRILGVALEQCNGVKGLAGELGKEDYAGDLFKVIALVDKEKGALTFEDTVTNYGNLIFTPKTITISSYIPATP